MLLLVRRERRTPPLSHVPPCDSAATGGTFPPNLHKHRERDAHSAQGLDWPVPKDHLDHLHQYLIQKPTNVPLDPSSDAPMPLSLTPDPFPLTPCLEPPPTFANNPSLSGRRPL